MKPIIGIVARVEYPGNTHKLVFGEEYRNKIIKHGAIALGILPPQEIDYTTERFTDQKELTDEEKEMLIKQIEMCNGILMPGGFKMNVFDRFILEYAIEKDIPVLGICLGMQIMSNYKREKVWNEKNDSFINHKIEEGLAHSVTIDKESKLFEILKSDKLMVTSRHSYHALPNEYFKITSLSEDNYIESLEMDGKKYIIGVQWHPETMNDESSALLFDSFLDACKK